MLFTFTWSLRLFGFVGCFAFVLAWYIKRSWKGNRGSFYIHSCNQHSDAKETLNEQQAPLWLACSNLQKYLLTIDTKTLTFGVWVKGNADSWLHSKSNTNWSTQSLTKGHKSISHSISTIELKHQQDEIQQSFMQDYGLRRSESCRDASQQT